MHWYGEEQTEKHNSYSEVTILWKQVKKKQGLNPNKSEDYDKVLYLLILLAVYIIRMTSYFQRTFHLKSQAFDASKIWNAFILYSSLNPSLSWLLRFRTSSFSGFSISLTLFAYL